MITQHTNKTSFENLFEPKNKITAIGVYAFLVIRYLEAVIERHKKENKKSTSSPFTKLSLLKIKQTNII